MILQDFREICLKRCGLDLDRPVLTAFSGGADSLSLIILLHQAGFPVIAAHFNHHIRENADRDEYAAGSLANGLGIPFISGGGNVPEFIRANHLSIEEGARQLRYRWLLDQARDVGAQALAVGHTADDQVETVLMHLLRGSGLDGLTGMPVRQILPVWGSDIPIVRPLLSFWRKDTEAVCSDLDLMPVQDESNNSTTYFRNRIRLELIPNLQTYNPQVKIHILQTTGILAEEQSILREIKALAWDGCLLEQLKNRISFKLDMLLKQQEGLRRAILREALVRLSPDIRDIEYGLTARMSDFVSNPSRSGEMCLVENIWIQHTTDRLTIWKGKPGLLTFVPQLEEGQIFRLDVPGQLACQDWTLDIREDEIDTARNAIQKGGLSERVWLDYDKLEFPLEIRGARIGERIQPFGLAGKSQKLSDYFINQKIPRQARRNWPLVFSGQNLVWVIGYGIGEKAAITPETGRVVRFSLLFPVRPPDG